MFEYMFYLSHCASVLGLRLPFKRKGAHRCWPKACSQQRTGSAVVALPERLLRCTDALDIDCTDTDYGWLLLVCYFGLKVWH